MGKPTGFMEYDRQPMPLRDPAVRINDFYEIYAAGDEHQLKEQGARCMDCGVPFCHADSGCPIDNLIPEWNDLVYRGRWHEAFLRLSKTNNFPEFTGRVCPAPCEEACVLGIHEPAVTIKSIESAIIDRAFAEGWVQPNPPEVRTGRTVAIIGSGPAGLAAADQLNRAGHKVTVFERDDRLGGLLMYGVPNMKLEKSLVQRRIGLLEAEGVVFKTNCNIGGDPADHGSAGGAQSMDPRALLRVFDAVLIATGALKARDMDLPGRELAGVHRAMTYLWQSTCSLLDSGLREGSYLHARDKHVIVIGGGDTGTDCIGTAIRQGARSVINITRREREPQERDLDHPWPGPRGTYVIDYGHAEGLARWGRDPREYGVLPLSFLGNDQGQLQAVRIVRLQWARDPQSGRLRSTPIPGSQEDLPADLVFIAAGFTGSDSPTLAERLGVEVDGGLIRAAYGDYRTNVEKVFAAGDARRGASLVVWAIAEGRGAARAIDQYLMGGSELPAPDMATGLLSSAG